MHQNEKFDVERQNKNIFDYFLNDFIELQRGNVSFSRQMAP